MVYDVSVFRLRKGAKTDLNHWISLDPAIDRPNWVGFSFPSPEDGN
jgi:hypothetical protein